MRLTVVRQTSPSGQGLRRDHKLRRSVDYLRCYRQGRRRHGSLATLHYHPNDKPTARLGITASRKVGNAVVRHRLKRRIREVFRRWEGRAMLPCLDIVVHLKPAAGGAEFGALKSELEALLARLPVHGDPASGCHQARRRSFSGERRREDLQ